jgi:hypothetical protein
MDKIKLTVDATVKEFEKLEQALDRNDHRAVGAALYHVRRELNTLKTLIGDAGTVDKVQIVNPEDLDPRILSDLNTQLFKNEIGLVDEETLHELDDDWDKAKRGGEAGHER